MVRAVNPSGTLARLERRLAALLAGARGRGPDDALRAEVTILATLLFGAVGLPLALRCWLLGARGVAAVVMGLMGLGIVNVLALRRARGVTAFAHAAVSLLVSLFVVAGLCSGGFYDPAFSWLFVAPSLAFLLTGLHGGWAWTGIVSAVTVAFWGCDAAGVTIGSLVPASQRGVQGLADRLSNLTGLAAVATAFLFSRKRHEQALADELAARRRAEEDAIAAAIAKTSFLAHMSHEIRTPMVGILGASELLLQTGLTGRQHGLATTIETSTRALLGILNNVLDLSRIDAGRLAVVLEPVDARLVCEDVADLLASPAASRDVDLVVAWGADVPARVLADPLRLRQILVNLVGNAVKFTERGHVVVRATCDAEPPDGPPRLRIAVEDTGIGIPSAQLARLFEPFVQADQETTRRYGGSGLGLAIAKQLVELMGGTVGAESVPGTGSSFWFTLPLATGEAQAPAAPLAGRHVLVVSDRPQTTASLTATLGGWGALVSSATSVGAACGDADTARRADVLLVDVRVADAAALWVDGALRPELPRRTILLVAPQAAALRLCGDIDATISLPCRAQHLLDAVRTPETVTLVVEAVRPRTARVLVADDVEVNREIARQQLEQIGCVVDLAATGREAVAQCREHPYDLVLMDCHMPELDGFAATAAIRTAPGPNRDTPIVALTASAFAEERNRCTESGMNGYLTKPTSQRELAACLDRFVTGTAPSPPASGTPAAADPETVLDVEATLDRIGGNTELFVRLIGIFRRQTPPMLRELHDAIGGRDAGNVRAVAHKLKGSLRSIGGRSAQTVAAELEECAVAGTLDGAPSLYDRLSGELARLDDALGGYLAAREARDDG